ncbi:MAG: XTP/dITP diphosphatase [Oscillospiraceae bacterium]|nr:XTP/dITP diphosphatase [Oscillospiraceae bacterium]
MQLIIASNNKGKIREFKELLDGFGFEVISMREAGFTDEIVEDGDTFERNAQIKAQAVFAATKSPVIADDSGLEIESLNGAPGVYSARYAGENATDKDRCDKVLREMENVPYGERGARFVCSICLKLSEDEEYHVNGTVSGFIGHESVGNGGFGYDPIFMLNDTDSMATIGEDEKNRISHRAQALEKLKDTIKERFNDNK